MNGRIREWEGKDGKESEREGMGMKGGGGVCVRYCLFSSKYLNPNFIALCRYRSHSNNNPDDNNKGDKFSTDWDKAWSKFRKQSKKTLFSQFSPNKYVTWNPRRSEYPLSEEIDPIKRTERSNLELWTSPRFTLVLAILILTFLLLYTILSPIR